VEVTQEVARVIGVIGSGGVSSVAHLRALADAGAEGAIIGTALYEGRLTLQDALSVAC
jgi:phosphoribosylformimino-5-aminoimidazole carboxamide ribonucleotide (ProFAR) isomerase